MQCLFWVLTNHLCTPRKHLISESRMSAQTNHHHHCRCYHCCQHTKTALTHPIPASSTHHSACSRIINPVRLHILHHTNGSHHQLDCVWWVLHRLYQCDVCRLQSVQCSYCICRIVQEPVTMLCFDTSLGN